MERKIFFPLCHICDFSIAPACFTHTHTNHFVSLCHTSLSSRPRQQCYSGSSSPAVPFRRRVFFPSVTWSSLMLVLLFPDRLVSSHRIYGGFLHWYLHSNQIECINMKIWLDCVWRSSVDAHEKLLIQNKSIRSVFLMQTYNAIFGGATSSNNNEHCTAHITHITTTYAGLEEDRTIDNVQKIAHKPHKHTNTHEQCEFSQTIFHILTCISCTFRFVQQRT